MTWATTVGVDGGQRQATEWVMMWAMMWAMGMMAAMTLATMPAKGMAGTLIGREGGGFWQRMRRWRRPRRPQQQQLHIAGVVCFLL